MHLHQIIQEIMEDQVIIEGTVQEVETMEETTITIITITKTKMMMTKPQTENHFLPQVN